MRRFFRRLNHRDAVMKNLEALLLNYPRGRQFARDFPKLKAVLRDDFEAGVPPTLAALKISESVIGNFVGQLDAPQKAKVLDALVEGGRARYADVARKRVRGARAKERDEIIHKLPANRIIQRNLITMNPNDSLDEIARLM